MAPHKKGFMALTANPLSSQKNYRRRKKTSQHYDKNLLLLSQMAELQQYLDQCDFFFRDHNIRLVQISVRLVRIQIRIMGSRRH